MTIKSLEDLNTYALTPIIYTDVRAAQVLFDRGATVNQTLTVSENYTFIFPWGINIQDITQFDVALMEYEIDLSAWTSTPVNVTWDYLPAHVTTSRAGNVFTVSNIRSGTDWFWVRQARVQPPFGFTGLIVHTGKLSWFADSAATVRTTASWNANITFTAVEYFSVAPNLNYTANSTQSNIPTTSIIADPDEFDPEWTLRIYPSDTSTVAEIFSDGSPGEATWNNTTKTFTIVGDSVSVNDILSTLDIEFARSDADFVLNFSLANNFTSTVELQVQQFFSRDFIADANAAGSASATGLRILGLVGAEINAIISAGASDPKRFRDPNPTTISAVNTVDALGGIVYPLDSEMNSAASSSTVPLRIKQLEADISVSSSQTVSYTRIRSYSTSISSSASWNANAYKHQNGFVIDFDTSADPLTTFELKLGGTNSTVIDWIDGDGTVTTTTVNDSDFEHQIGTFLAGGTWRINYEDQVDPLATASFGSYPGSYSGLVTAVVKGPCKYLAVTDGRAQAYNIANWGTNGITSFYRAFEDTSIVTVPYDKFPTTVFNCARMFESSDINCDLNGWNTSNVRTMQNMFASTQFNGNISSWDVSNVSTFRGMFALNNGFTGNLNSWDLTGVEYYYRTNPFGVTPRQQEESIENMFQGLYLSGTPYGANPTISNWNISNAYSIQSMFRENTKFNGDISGWNTGNITDMSFTFYQSVFNQDISSWDTSSVTTMVAMFNRNEVFDQDISSWDVSNVTDYAGFDDFTNPNWTAAEKPSFP